jgi:predicted metal-dependent phosphoesterase TrpH
VKLELHCHSTCSDGSLPPHEVAAMAVARGAELFCLTDHDTDRGFDATLEAVDGACPVLRGLELSCREHDRTIHLLVYGLVAGPGLDALYARLEAIDVDRRSRLLRICARLAALGIELDADAVLAKTEGKTPGRPDVARALVEAGAVKSPREAFDRYLRDGGPADVPIEKLSVADGVALALAAGAKVSVAHPHTMGHFALVRDLYVRCRDAGLDGIEAYYGKYGQAQTRTWLDLARQFDLVPTGGSDFHGDMSPDVKAPTIELPAEVGQRIRDWLGA